MSLTDLASESNGAGPHVRYRDPVENRWSDAAPKRLRKRYPLRGVPGGWEAWRRYLGQRRRPKSLDELAGGLALDWALPDAVALTPAGELYRRLVDWNASRGAADDNAPPSTSLAEKSLADTLTTWLAGGPGVDSSLAYEALAWSRALRWLVDGLDESQWWRLFERLVELALDGDPRAGDDPLVDQLLSAELALSLAYELPEVAAATELAARGHTIAQRGLRENSLGDGLPPARLMPTARALLACWTRVWTISKKLDRAALQRHGEHHDERGRAEPDGEANHDQQAGQAPRHEREAPKTAIPAEFGDFLATTLRLCRPDGSQMLSSDGAGAWNRRLFAAAGKLANRRSIDTAQRIAQPDRRAAGKKAARKTMLKPSAHGESAGVALLRTDWRAGAARLAVSFDAHAVKLELIAGKVTLLSGLWSLDVRLAGKAAEFTSAWEEICWVSDRDVDYLEIEAKLSGGLRVQRQLLLARNDRFLFLADGVLAPEASEGPLEYRSRLGLAASAQFEPAPESCEGHLVLAEPEAHGKPSPRALVLPLRLPEWRGAARNGELRSAEGALELTHRSPGRRLFAPLFFDLDRRRFKRQFTWRRLTVAESLAATPDDVAVGQRVEIGDQQWLFYRSLAARTPRTVLGQHFASEFLAGRFHRNGEVDRLLEVESE